MKPLYFVLAFGGLGFAQQIEHLPRLVRSFPAYVGSDGSLYAISEVGCSKFLPCTRWVVYRFTLAGEYVGLTDLAGVSMERPTLVRVDATGRIYAAGLQKDGAVWIFDGGNYRNMYSAGQPRGTPVELAFDKSGNVLFLGRSVDDGTAFLVHMERDSYKEIARIHYRSLSPAAMATGADGSVYIAGTESGRPVVFRLFEGNRTTYAFDGELASPQAIAAGRNGVYVAGRRMKTDGHAEGVIVRLDSGLTTLEKSATLGGEATDSVNWLGLDDQERVLAAGVTTSYHLPATGAFRTPCGADRGTGRNWANFLARYGAELDHLQAYTPVYGISPAAAPAFSRFGDAYWVTNEPIRWFPDFNPVTAVTCVVRADYSPALGVSDRELVTIFGQGFTDRAQEFADADQLPLEVDGLSIQWGSVGFDARPAAILSISPTQINVVLPRVFVQGDLTLALFRKDSMFHLQRMAAPAPTPAALVRVSGEGELAGPVDRDLAETAVLADVLNEDGTPNNREHRARPGELVTLFITGTGGLPDDVSERDKGTTTPARPRREILIETVDGTIRPETVSTIPGRTTGVLQVRFRVPQEFAGGELGFGFDRPEKGVRARPYFLYTEQ